MHFCDRVIMVCIKAETGQKEILLLPLWCISMHSERTKGVHTLVAAVLQTSSTSVAVSDLNLCLLLAEVSGSERFDRVLVLQDCYISATGVLASVSLD